MFYFKGLWNSLQFLLIGLENMNLKITPFLDNSADELNFVETT